MYKQEVTDAIQSAITKMMGPDSVKERLIGEIEAEFYSLLKRVGYNSPEGEVISIFLEAIRAYDKE